MRSTTYFGVEETSELSFAILFFVELFSPAAFDLLFIKVWFLSPMEEDVDQKWEEDER